MRIDISKLKNNPNNPRIIRDHNFKKLVGSIKKFPEMLEVRPIVCNKDYVVLGGNMRLKAMQEAGIKETEIKIVEFTPEQEREFIIKDNLSYGEWDWDLLANEWESEQLAEWGLVVQDPFEFTEQEKNEDTELKEKEKNICPNCGVEFKI